MLITNIEWNINTYRFVDYNDFYHLKCWAGWFKTGTLSSFLFSFAIQLLFMGVCFIWCFSMKNLRLSWSKNDPLVAIRDLTEALLEFVVIKERTLVLILAIFFCYRWFIIGWPWKKEFSNFSLELVSKELNHLAAILHVCAGCLNFMK